MDALQELLDDKLDLLAISLPPGAGKTTLALFFLTMLGGKFPDEPILTGSHSNSFVRGAYDECLRIMDPQGEYLWHIPALVAILGVALAIWMNWPNITPEVILGGAVSGLASTGMHQMFKQWIDNGGK